MRNRPWYSRPSKRSARANEQVVLTSSAVPWRAVVRRPGVAGEVDLGIAPSGDDEVVLRLPTR